MIQPRLNSSNLGQAHPNVQVPQYDRSSVNAGIVHFGVGAFHRSHQAMIIDDLLNSSLTNPGIELDWGICGVGLLPNDARIGKALQEQDFLYTLAEKHPDGSQTLRVIGSLINYLYAPDNPQAVLDQLAHPDIKIVSLTITEGGYNFDPSTLEFDDTNPTIIADLAGDGPPSTVFGYITESLRLRRDRGISAFTIVSCDNIQGNGHVAHDMFLAYATRKDPALAEWIGGNMKFPNSMVDRITPVTTEEDIHEISTALGLVDLVPVVAEPFFQWVLEDDFVSVRPAFENSRVQLVADVEPYELMKLRLLNASHQALAYFGFLSGFHFVHDAASDPAAVTLLKEYMNNEATATLLPVPGIDLDAYKNELIERFQNPEVKDTIARLCAESSDRIPKWLVPVINERLAQGLPVDISAGIVASWARYAQAIDEKGEPIVVVDQLRDQILESAAHQKENPLAFLENRKLFGDLIDNPNFTKPYLASLKSLWNVGAHATMSILGRHYLHFGVSEQEQS